MSRCIRERWPRTGAITADETGRQGRRTPKWCRPRGHSGAEGMWCRRDAGRRSDRTSRGARRSRPDRLCTRRARGTMEPFFAPECVNSVVHQHDSWITVIIHQMRKRREGAIGGRSTPGDGMSSRRRMRIVRVIYCAMCTRRRHGVAATRCISALRTTAVCMSRWSTPMNVRRNACRSGRRLDPVQAPPGRVGPHGIRSQAGDEPGANRGRMTCGATSHRSQVDPQGLRTPRGPATPARRRPDSGRVNIM